MLIPRLETFLCDTSECRDLHFRLRYRVFCEQTGFENPGDFPDGKERDQYDDFASHFLMWDRLARRCVGAMRLIDAKKTALPSESICRFPLEGLDAARGRSVEFSRLAILRDRRDDSGVSDSEMQCPQILNTVETIPFYRREEKNEALLRLLWVTFEWAIKNDIDYCYGIITAPLARILKRYGIPLTQVGVEVKHRGVRRPYRYNVHEAKEGMSKTLPYYAHLFQSSPAFVPYSDLRGNARGKIEARRARISAYRGNRLNPSLKPYPREQ